jgi:hypothetical protein
MMGKLLSRGMAHPVARQPLPFLFGEMMIRSPLRAGLALACALSLSACGGGGGEIYVGGQVSGVTKAGLVLTNNGGSDLEIPAYATTFVFKDLVETDERYFVEVKSWPSNVEKKEDCVVLNPTGRAVFNVSNIEVNCTIRKRALGGTIIDLGNASGLELVNGSDRVVVPPGTTKLTMPPVSEDSPYGVTVLKQPAGRTCTVENGSGTMPAGPVDSIVVRCTQ